MKSILFDADAIMFDIASSNSREGRTMRVAKIFKGALEKCLFERRTILFGLLISSASFVPAVVQAQDFDNGQYYRLTTLWQGEGKSLDVVNDGQKNKLILADSGNYSGQYWKFTRVAGGYYRLTTQWQGEGKSLDVVNDGVNNKLSLAATGNYSGQHWRVVRQSNGYYRLTTQWRGEGKSLDVVNDGANNKLILADTGDYSGQYWRITGQ